MKTIITAIVCFLSVAISAQNTTNLRTAALAASVIKINKSTSNHYQGNVLLNRLPATAPAAPHNSAHSAAVALLVLGPVKMAVGLGVLAWTGAHYNDINRGREPRDVRVTDRGVTFGAVLGTFHVLTGAALTAGGVVLLKRSRGAYSGAYLTLPEPVSPASAGGTNNGMGLRTSIVF
ncbi:MAG TPA: hypothetical protein VK154_04990 [Chitinophagales bacterium]|nr:hypothetical protein [Chitinophagales bacterium]